jgi:hypothetical protein
LPGGVLRVRNRGGTPWQGQVRSAVPWLRLESETVICPAGGETAVRVALTSQVNDFFRTPRPVVVDDALELSGPGVMIRVELRLDVRSAGFSRIVPPPAVETAAEVAAPTAHALPRIDFGTLAAVLDAWPACTWSWRNASRQPVKGLVRSTLPWLEVEPAEFSAQSNEEVVLTARLTEKVLGLRPKRYAVPDGIVLEAGGEIYQGMVQLTLVSTLTFAARTVSVTPPPAAVESVMGPSVAAPEAVAAWQIDFGRAAAGELAGMRRELLLEPPFGEPVEGSACSTLPWLAVEPARFSWRPGEALLLRVSLTKDATRLRPKTYEIADALEIAGGGRQFKVGVSLEVTAAASVGPLLPEGLGLDFGAVAEGRFVPVIRELRWVHRQMQALNGRAESTLPWVEVVPEQFTAQPGQEVVLAVRLTEKAARLRAKRYDSGDGLILYSGGQSQPVRIMLTVGNGNSEPARVSVPVATAAEVPDGLRVEPAGVDWGRVTDWRGMLPAVTLTVTNGSRMAWQGTAHSTLPWLVVEPGAFSAPAGGRAKLQVRLTEAGARLRRGKSYQVADGLVIEVNGQTVWVEVKLEI